MPKKFRYEELTWPEAREAAGQDRVAVVPVGTMEQHGPHLPLATNALAAAELSRLAVKRVPEEALLLPPVYYGASERHMDFPGTIAVDGMVLVGYLTGIVTSLAHHGFRKIMMVNGPDGNQPFLDICARNVNNATESLCAVVSWWKLIPPQLLRELGQPRANGCEMETSVLLYLRGDLVQMDRAEREAPEEAGSLALQEPVSRYSRTGAPGDPAEASSEKGRRLVEAAVERLAAAITEFRAREIRPRVDHH